MAKAKRNIGLEILEGLRQLKRGEYGRVVTVPALVQPASSSTSNRRHASRSRAGVRRPATRAQRSRRRA